MAKTSASSRVPRGTRRLTAQTLAVLGLGLVITVMLYEIAVGHRDVLRHTAALERQVADNNRKAGLLTAMGETVQRRITRLDALTIYPATQARATLKAGLSGERRRYADARETWSSLAVSDHDRHILAAADAADDRVNDATSRLLTLLSTDYGTDEKTLATATRASRTAHLALLAALHEGLRTLQADTPPIVAAAGAKARDSLLVQSGLGALAFLLAIATAALVIVNTGAQARRLAHDAEHDALTGLHNRVAFEAALDAVLARCRLAAESHALLVIGIDRFKIVNETFGHAGGDRLLREVAELLRSAVADNATLSRLGGDEFGLLLRSVSPGLAEAQAEELRAAIARYAFEQDGHRVPVAASIGMVTFGDQQVAVGELLRNATACCLSAKDEGRNRVHLATTQSAQIRRRSGDRQWLNRIRDALQNDRFVLHGQSIHPLRTGLDDGRLCLEVLLRLDDDGGLGLIPPQQFLPTAERYHVINDIDRWVVRNSLEWLVDQGPTAAERLRININICGLTASDPQFHRYVRDLIRDTGAPPESLCFEITESLGINNLAHAAALVNSLGDLGCRFALDDFGSGLSSFSQLRHLAVDYLKIDGGFVYNIERDPVNRALVESINSLGHRLGKLTVAEFVTNDQIRQILAEIGVDYVQGFALHRPEALTDIGERLRHSADEPLDPARIFVARGVA